MKACMMKIASWSCFAVLLSSMLLASSALAQDATEPEPAPSDEVAVDLSEAAPSSPWRFELDMWLWMFGVTGDIGIGAVTAEVDASLVDIAENSDSILAFSGRLEVGYDRFAGFVDGTYISTSPVQLVVNSWDDTDPRENPDSMTAPYAPALQAKTGDWDAGINLSGASAPGNVVLKKFSAAGTAGGVWQLAGDVGAIAVNDTDETFIAVIDDAVKSFASKAGFTGLLPGHNFSKVSIKTDAANARIIAGGDFDAAGLTSTFIKSLSIGGAMTLSTVEVGLDFNNDDPDDIVGFVGGANNDLQSAKIGGEAGDDNHFTAGLFPSSVSINKVKVDPLNDPLGRFTLTVV